MWPEPVNPTLTWGHLGAVLHHCTALRSSPYSWHLGNTSTFPDAHLSHIRITSTPVILLPSHRPCQTHQHLFHVTAQSPAFSDSPAPLSYYCPVTIPVRITSTPFPLRPSHQSCQNHQHPFHTTAQSAVLSKSPPPLSYYCPVTSPVRFTNAYFLLLPSYQPC